MSKLVCPVSRRAAFRLLCSVSLSLTSAAWAQAPTAGRQVTLVVPYAAGGATDLVARALADALRKQTGSTYIVENRAGANGAIAAEYVSRAAKDGSVVLVGNPATQSVLPLLLAKKPRFEVAVPVASVATVPGVLVAAKDFPARNVAEMVEQVKRQPGKVSYASAGIGSMAHLSFLAIAEQADLDMIHVPYKSGPQALSDNLGGLVQLNFLNLATAAPLVKDGKLKALAVSGSSRTEQLPDVPTLQEQGYEGALTPNWQGLFLPPGTPQNVVDELAAQVARAQQTPELRAQLAAANITVSPSDSPKAFAAFVDKATHAFRTLISKHNLEVN